MEQTKELPNRRGPNRHTLYKAWGQIKYRCYCDRSRQYKHYGAVGISMCEEWRNDFMAFYNWSIENGWAKGLVIDRFPNMYGNYEPSNCRWVSQTLNNRNKKTNIYITISGVTKCLAEWAEDKGLRYKVLYMRVKTNWPVDRYFDPPNSRLKNGKETRAKLLLTTLI